MKKLKVLFVIDTLEGYGAEKSLLELTTSFKKIIPVFVHIYQGDMLKPKLEEAGIRVYSLDLTKKYAFNTALKKLSDIYLQERPDIVHATLFRSEIIARKLKKTFPEICLVGSFVSNAYSPERFLKKNALDKLKLSYFQNLDKQTAGLVDYFISNSQTIKDRTTQALEITENIVQVIYRGRNSSVFNPEHIKVDLPYLNNGKLILLNVSRLIPLKGQVDLLKALPEVIKLFPKIQLVFAGHGSYRENLERYSRKLGVQEHIRFLGRIDNIQKLLIKSDIFLYPSYSEGLPGALIEAMMAERIIIASNISENLECVDENCALIYKKGDVNELASKIIMVLKDPEKYHSLARNARLKAIEKFELKKVVLEYENFYENIAPKRNFIESKEHKRTLRILHLIQKPQNRGAEMFTCQLSNHLIESGHQVKIIALFEGEANLPFHGEVTSLKASSKNRFFDLPAWKNLAGIVKEFNPDIIQANAGDTLKYAVFSKKYFGWKTPIISRNASEVGRYLKSPIQKSLNSFFYKNVEFVISVSQASEKDILNHFPFLLGKTEVIPVGLEPISKIEEIILKPENSQHIVHVGGFSFEKNHSGLLRIFQSVLRGNPYIHLHLVGDGPLKTEIEEEVGKMNMRQNITFYGFVNNPLSFIKAANVLVLPSVIEGLPGVLLEAMMCKTPVVAYNVGGISEIVTSKTGNLIEKDDEAGFVKAVLETLENPNIEQIETAQQMVLGEYMNEEIAGRFVEVYEAVTLAPQPPKGE